MASSALTIQVSIVAVDIIMIIPPVRRGGLSIICKGGWECGQFGTHQSASRNVHQMRMMHHKKSFTNVYLLHVRVCLIASHNGYAIDSNSSEVYLGRADITTRESCPSDTIIHLPYNAVFSVVLVFDTSLKILKRAIVDASCGSRRSRS